MNDLAVVERKYLFIQLQIDPIVSDNWIVQLFGLMLLVGAAMVIAKMFAKAVRGVLIEFGSEYFYTGELVVFWATTLTLTAIILKIALFPSKVSTK